MEKIFVVDGSEVKVNDFKASAQSVSFSYEGKDYEFSLTSESDFASILNFEGQRLNNAVSSVSSEGEAMVIISGVEAKVGELNKRSKKSRVQSGSLVSPMPGKIFKIIKEVGSEVKKGEPILILEAMKMEHSIRADKDGKVTKISYQVGDLVQGGVVLAEVGQA